MLLELCSVFRGAQLGQPHGQELVWGFAATSLGGKGSSVVYWVDQALSPRLTAPCLETGSWHMGRGGVVTQSSNQC